MKLTEKEKIQEQLSQLRHISQLLFESGDIRRGQDVRDVVNNLSTIIKNMK